MRKNGGAQIHRKKIRDSVCLFHSCDHLIMDENNGQIDSGIFDFQFFSE